VFSSSTGFPLSLGSPEHRRTILGLVEPSLFSEPRICERLDIEGLSDDRLGVLITLFVLMQRVRHDVCQRLLTADEREALSATDLLRWSKAGDSCF
jgi:hypothetical protein